MTFVSSPTTSVASKTASIGRFVMSFLASRVVNIICLSSLPPLFLCLASEMRSRLVMMSCK